MTTYSLTHLADVKLAQGLRAGVVGDRAVLAIRLAQLAEFDHRRLYLPAHPSMYQFCLRELGHSEDEACKRIHVARAARRFQAIFDAIAHGRHNLTTVDLLAPCLLPENFSELLAATSGMTKSEVAHVLAERFSQRDVPTVVQAIHPPLTTSAPPAPSPSPARSSAMSTPSPVLSVPERIGTIDSDLPPHSAVPVPPYPRIAPLSPERYAIQVTVSKATHDKLRQAQALLSHALPSGDVAEVLERALDALILQLERRKFGATDRPRPARTGASKDARHIPAHVRRAVRARDGDRCTFVDDRGRRCTERKFLEFDHEQPVGRGGEASSSGIRLRCRAHNQYEAERTFGARFMEHKRAFAAEHRVASKSAAVASGST